VTTWISDVNGVLVDSTSVVRRAFAATAAHYGFPFCDEDFRAIGGWWLLEAYRRLDRGGDAAVRRRYHLAFVRERIAEMHAYPDVHDTLNEARQRGVRVGAVTSHGEIAEACLVHTGLYAFIECLVTQEEVKRPKPWPDAVLLALDLLGAETAAARDEALYIGDTSIDVQAGKASGVCTIAATYGVSRPADLVAAAPDHMIASFADMRRFMGERGAPAAAQASEPGEDVL
jgi:pyrophosphatase PpaX